MAERGAHFTVTSLPKPSIFEVIAQESLRATFHPAVKSIAQFLAARNPESSGWLIKWFEEVYLILNTLLQYHYLRYNDGSFSETFYGLRRIGLNTLSNPSKPSKLSPHQLRASLLLLTLFPYLRVKLKDAATKYRLEEGTEAASRNEWEVTWRHTIILLHRVFHVSWESLVMIYYVRYMSGKTDAHCPSFALAGVALRYAPEPPSTNLTWSQVWKSFTAGRWKWQLPSAQLVGSTLTRSLEIGAFFIQFLQWWHSEQTRTDITALPVPEAPPASEKCGKPAGLCPICMRPWSIETALTVSGYVFCYRCIRSHLRENSTCPVTGYPASVEDLVRLYSSQS